MFSKGSSQSVQKKIFLGQESEYLKKAPEKKFLFDGNFANEIKEFFPRLNSPIHKKYSV
jgi:hypothetical protein